MQKRANADSGAAVWDQPLTPHFSHVLDHVRWMAAFVVMAGHVRNNLFVPYHRIEAPTAAVKIFYTFTNLQNEAVICFFVLSGFLIGGKLYRYHAQGRVPVWRYIVDRLTRLNIVLLPAVAVTFAVGAIGACPAISTSEWVGSLLYVQHVLTAVPACNAPLWSLTNEFWYYLIGLLIVLLPRYRVLALIGLSLSLAVLANDSLNRENVLVYFGVWGLGTILIRYDWVAKVDLGLWFAFAFFVAALAISRSHIADGIYVIRDYAIAVGLFLILLAYRRRTETRMVLPRFGHFMAGFSYSLYLLHWPIIMTVRMVLARTGFAERLAPGDAHVYGIYTATCALCLVVSLVLAFVTERNTGRVRQLILATRSLVERA